jgi:vancomycin permeability regulator SanA
MRRTLQILFRVIPFILLVAICSVGLAIYAIRSQTQSLRYSIENVPAKRVALVFGAGVRSDGSPSAVLQDRISTAATLYTNGTVAKILVSGDNGSADYNEVVVMQRELMELGVPSDDIRLDYAGFSTYDTCYRAYHVFGVRDAVLVTQRFHQPRALYTCKSFGIDVVGVDIPDYERYPNLQYRQEPREWLATLSAWLDVHIIKPTAKFPGPAEPTL